MGSIETEQRLISVLSKTQETLKKSRIFTKFHLDTLACVYYNNQAATFWTGANSPCPGDATVREMSYTI